ncbi:MAG TPA: hypothetical protein VJ821_02360 [Anaerolineales bacterium]|nr:hypothetical protein [Anaerolineales bacterium]
MIPTKFRIVYVLSIVIAILAALASAAGLFVPNLYRGNALTTSVLRGNDLVTLAVAVPLLIVAMIFSRKGSQRAQLVWMGALGYMLYNYVFYLYGAAFNRVFLLYIALFTASVYALIFGLTRLQIKGISQKFQTRTPVKWISAYMLFIAIFIGGLWISRSLNFILTGIVPDDITKFGHPTAMVYATDLSLMIPTMFLGAILLWKRRDWGFVLGVIMMVKGTTYMTAMMAMMAFAGGLGSDPLALLWTLLLIGCLLAGGFLLGNLQSEKSTGRRKYEQQTTLAA